MATIRELAFRDLVRDAGFRVKIFSALHIYGEAARVAAKSTDLHAPELTDALVERSRVLSPASKVALRINVRRGVANYLEAEHIIPAVAKVPQIYKDRNEEDPAITRAKKLRAEADQLANNR